MDFIISISIPIFLFFSIIGLIYCIKERNRIVELTNFQIDKETILGFLLMLIVGAVTMFFIFSVNKEFGYVKIESSNHWILSVKQIPGNFASAFNQELLFRIFVFLAIISISGNKLIALYVSSLIFCLVHAPVGVISILSYFTAGLMYGLAFLKFKSIWAAIGLHFSWNYFQGAIFGFPVSKEFSQGYFNILIEDNDFWNGGDVGPEGSVLGVICRILIILIILILGKKYRIKKSTNFLLKV